MKRVYISFLSLLLVVGMQTGCSRCDDSVAIQDPIAAGWERFRMGEFDEAVVIFDAVRNGTACEDADMLAATYGLGNVWDLRMPMTSQDKDLAKKLYQEVIDTAPDHELAAWSSLAIARMQHLVPVGHEPDYNEVRKAYTLVWEMYPDTQAGQEAFIHLQASYIQTMDQDEIRLASQRLQKFVENHPQSGLRYAAWSLLAESYAIQGKPDELLNAEIETLNAQEIDKTNPFVENSWRYWKIAVTAEFEAGDFGVAREYYQRLIDEYPQDIRRYGCEDALRRMSQMEQKIRDELAEEGEL